MSKFYHNTQFLNQIFSKGKNEIVDKSTMGYRLSLILLNRPINKRIFAPLFRHATNVVMCDGASNRLYDTFESDKSKYLPTHICGDLDSCRQDVLEYYQQQGVRIEKQVDQDSNDFQKSISLLTSILSDDQQDSCEEQKEIQDKIIVLFPFNGRIDQTLSSMHILSKVTKEDQFIRERTGIMLMDESSTMQYLQPGINHIRIGEKVQSKLG